MKVYAISDLHLSGAKPKPMDVFGLHWLDHWRKIKQSWIEMITGDDIVLIPGDISWAMTLQEAIVDLEEIWKLPGKKIMIRGNHDYWWSSISKIRKHLPDDMYAIQNDSIAINGIRFCGTRGWIPPGNRDYSDNDYKIFRREVERLSLSLSTACLSDELIVLLHFPPFDENGLKSDLIGKMREYKVNHVVYGHLHSPFYKPIEGEIEGVNYHLVSCDYISFTPKHIM